jgi:Protein NO VEIN, C-terminal
MDAAGTVHHLHYAPYLDYRPLRPGEPGIDALLARPECGWISRALEQQAQAYSVASVVPEHLHEVRSRKLELIAKTEAAVKDRLTKEINYWDHRAAMLKDQELAGRVNAKLNSGLARQRADELATRLQKRTAELEQERKLSALPPVLLGGALIVPIGLLCTLPGFSGDGPPDFAQDTQRSERLAMQAVMDAERSLGYDPRDVSRENRGYDIESAIPGTGKLRFIEVKGRIQGAKTVTITKNEILTGLNKPDDYVLAIVLIDDTMAQHPVYIRSVFRKDLDFGVTSVNYDLGQLLSRGEEPS